MTTTTASPRVSATSSRTRGCLPWRTVMANIMYVHDDKSEETMRQGRASTWTSSASRASRTCTRRTCRVACSSASASRGRSRSSPTCCSWTSRSATWTRSPPAPCERSSRTIWKQDQEDDPVRHARRDGGGAALGPHHHRRVRRQELRRFREHAPVPATSDTIPRWRTMQAEILGVFEDMEARRRELDPRIAEEAEAASRRRRSGGLMLRHTALFLWRDTTQRAAEARRAEGPCLHELRMPLGACAGLRHRPARRAAAR